MSLWVEEHGIEVFYMDGDIIITKEEKEYRGRE